MAKKAYIGVNGVARQIKKMYVGVGGVARKVKKAYIGVAGVARCFFGGGGELSYYGYVTDLSEAKYDFSATTVGSNALFGGGYTGGRFSKYSSKVEVYNISLTQSSASRLSSGRELLMATHVGNYALFGGGQYAYSGSNIRVTTVDVYGDSLTKLSNLNLSVGRLAIPNGEGTVSFSNYSLFICGVNQNSQPDFLSTVDAFDSSLTKISSVPNLPTSSVENGCATAIGDYAVVWYDGRTCAYDNSLTVSTIPNSLIQRNVARGATSVGNYALFGGASYQGLYSKYVDAINSSFTISSVTALTVAKCNVHAVSVANYALFLGGTGGLNNYADTKGADAYDDSLTKVSVSNLDSYRRESAVTSVGDYALIGGGLQAYGIAKVEAYVVA